MSDDSLKGGYSYSLLNEADGCGISPGKLLGVKRAVGRSIRQVDAKFQLAQSIVARGALPRLDNGRVYKPALRAQLGLEDPMVTATKRQLDAHAKKLKQEVSP